MDNTQALQLFDKKLILLNVKANKSEELLRFLAKELYQLGYVKDTFSDALIAREQLYPTGLPTAEIGVAIPHADAEHVIKPVIAVANLAKPVLFKEIGNGQRDVAVQMVFMMAIEGPKKHLDLLQKFMSIFSNAQVLKDLKAANTVDDILGILLNQFT